jgi:vacuolar-type H+-ATPase subunit E/Vma4
MGLSEVKTAVKEKTQAEAAAIVESGHAEAQRIISEAQRQILQKRAAHSAKTTEILETMERKEMAAASFAAKAIILDQKRKALDKILNAVKERLIDLSEEQRTNLLRDIATSSQVRIQSQKIRCNSRDTGIISAIFPSASVAADDSISGGFVAENSEGTARIDCTYDTLLEAVREKHLAELTKATL